MFKKYSTRRQFLNYGKLPLLFLLNSCTNTSKKISISLQSSFYPKSLKDTLPTIWRQENMRELGAIIGLTMGYIIKYRLDKRFVFRQK